MMPSLPTNSHVLSGPTIERECLAILNAADEAERIILLNYALREAQRWKKKKLIHELCQLQPVTNGVVQQNGFHV